MEAIITSFHKLNDMQTQLLNNLRATLFRPKIPVNNKSQTILQPYA